MQLTQHPGVLSHLREGEFGTGDDLAVLLNQVETAGSAYVCPDTVRALLGHDCEAQAECCRVEREGIEAVEAIG